MAKAKTKAANLPVPQSDAEAEQMIARLGALQCDLASDQATHDARIAEIERKHGENVKTSKEAQTAITEGLGIWASANRERLTNGGRTKTVQLTSGTILWRDGRFSVKHRPLKVEDVVKAVSARIDAIQEEIHDRIRREDTGEVTALRTERDALQNFLRRKVELNKDAMLADRETAGKIPGVTVERGGEEFAVEPLASQIRGEA